MSFVFQSTEPLQPSEGGAVRTDEVTALNVFPGATGTSTLTLKFAIDIEQGMFTFTATEFITLAIPRHLKYPRNICLPKPSPPRQHKSRHTIARQIESRQTIARQTNRHLHSPGPRPRSHWRPQLSLPPGPPLRG